MFLQKVKRAVFPQFFLDMSAGRKIAYLGIFTALAVVVNVFSIDISATQKISFNYLFGFFAGTFFGPVAGFFICFLGDFIGFFLFSGGFYWPLTGINTGLLALLPGIVMTNVHFHFRGGVYVKAAISVLLMYLVSTCLFGTVSNYLYLVALYSMRGEEYTKVFAVYWTEKILFSTIVSAVNYILLFVMIPAFNAIKPLKVKIE